MKKWLAGILCSSILVSCVSVFGAERYGANMIDNPSFETGDLSKWLQEGRAQYRPNAVVESDGEGGYYVRLDASKLQDAMRFYQSNKTMYKDQVYKLSMKVMGIKENEEKPEISYKTSLRLKTKNGSGINYHMPLVFTNADINEFVNYQMLPEDSVCTIGVYAEMSSTNCKYLHVTDVKMEPVCGIDTYDFENGSLEMGSTGITVWDSENGASASIENDGYNSGHALYVTPNAGNYRHYVSFAENAPYHISGMMKAQAGDELELVFSAPDGTETVLTKTASNGQWQEVCAFMSAETLPAQRGYVYWRAKNGENLESYSLDNVKAVTDGDFEVSVAPSFDGYDFSVEIKNDCTAANGKVTLSNSDGEVLYTGDLDDMDGLYKFTVDSSLKTGTYTVSYSIDGFCSVSEQIFYYDKALLSVLESINAVSEGEIGALLVKNADLLGIDIQPYTEISDTDITGQINKTLAAADFSVDMNNLAADIESKSKFLADEYQKLIVPAYMADCKDASKLRAFAENHKTADILADKTYYSDIADFDKLYETMLKVRPCIKAFTVENDAYMKELYQNTVLVYTVNESDYRKIPEILRFYNDNGTISVSFEKYDALSSSQKASVLEKLKNAEIYNPSLYGEKLNELCDGEKSSTPAANPVKKGGSGGGGGGYSGVSFNDKAKTDTPEDNPSTDTQPETLKFNDLDSVPWAHEAIKALSESGAVSGRSSGIFDPDSPVTREEAIKILVGAFEIPTDGASAAFLDVNTDDWFYPFVAAAKKNGISNGIGGGLFGTGQNILRQDLAVMLFNIYEKNAENPIEQAVQHFEDYEDISDYAKTAVSVFCTLDVLNGKDNGCFAPKDYVTRAEAAKMIYNTLKIAGKDVAE